MQPIEFAELLSRYSSEGTPFLFLIDFEMRKPFICRLDEAADEGVFFDIRGMSNFSSHPGLSAGWAEPEAGDLGRGSPSILSPERNYIPACDYGRAFSTVLKNLEGGNTYLCNLTFPTEVSVASGHPDPLTAVCSRASAPYRLLFRDEFVMFSPECFVRIDDDYIYSYPMKGTIDASLPNAAETILNDRKEFWEHNTIVDLIRNDIGMISESVDVTRFRFLDLIRMPDKQLYQVSSEIRGKLPADWRSGLGSMLLRLLPAGSISGAPKRRTVEIIAEAEGGPRGYYTGVFGVFDGERLDSAVNIRYIEKDGGKLFFRSGGGITANSCEASEYQELKDKVNVPVG